MRIVHTCLRYPPASGGVETYVNEVVERTRNIEEQRDVRVLTSKLRTHHPASELHPESLVNDPPYIQRLHHSSTPGLAYPRLQALKYYLKHHQPGIIHAHSFWYQPADAAAAYAKKNNIPFILQPFYYENEIREKLIWKLYKSTIGRRTFATADAVVVISPFEQKLIEDAGFSVKRFILAPPGINHEELSQPQPNIFEKRNITRPIILTVSRLALGKGLEEAIAAMPDITKQIPGARLVIVGENFGAQANLQKQATKLGIEESIHFLGNLPRPELVSAFQHADVFLHPSHYEAFGIVLAESLAAGTPVVARNATAIPFVAPHEQASLLFNNKSELAQNVITLLQDENLNKKLATQGQQHVREKFSWNQTIKKMVDLYEQPRLM